MKDKVKSYKRKSTGSRETPGTIRTGSGGDARGTGTMIAARFQAVVAGTRDAIGISKAGIHVFVNPAYRELFGFPLDADLSGKPILDLIAPESRVQFKTHILGRVHGESLSSTYETRGLRIDGSSFDMAVNVSYYKESGEDHTLIILRDVTELKRAEEVIAERGAMLQQIMDTASVSIFLVDRSGRIVHANRRMAEMFGCSMENLVGSEYVDHVHPSERESGRQKMLDLLASKIPSVDLERLYWRKDSTEFWGHLAGQRFHDVHGNEQGLIGVITNISKRKQAEEALRNSEGRLNTILDNVGAYIFIKDTQYHYTYANRKVRELVGRSAEDILGKSDKDFFSVESVDEIMRSDRPVIERGETIAREEIELTSSDKVPRTFWTVKLPLRDSMGTVTGLCGISTDITEHRHAEEALRASEKKFSAIFDLMPDPTTITDTVTGIILDLNDAAARLFGRSRDEVIGKTSAEIRVWEIPSDRDRMLHMIRTTGDINDMEFRLRRQSGELRDVLFSSRIIEINGKSCLLSRVHDITDRKKIEEVLRISEEKFRKVFLTSPDAININRLQDGMYILINDGFTTITGYTAEDVIGKTSLELNIWAVPADRRKMVDMLQKHGEVKNLEARFCTKDGQVIDGLMSASIIEIDHLPYIVSVTHDITEHKRFELTLKQSEEKYRRLYNETPILLHSIDRNGIVVEVNDYWLKTMGYERNEVIGRKVTDFYTEVSRKYALEVIQPAFFQHGFAKDVSYQFVKKNGDIVDVLISATAERDASGNVVRSQAVIEDITERNRAEEALHENQARLDLALQSAHMGVWRWEIRENKRYFNDLTCQLLGIDATTFTGKLEEFFRAVHPDDREKIKAALTRTVEQDVLYEPTYRVVWPDGSVHHIAARGRLVRDDKGQPIRINGILWDITDQRLLEDERLKTQKLESIGTLAGGIAHDFNNLLQGVFGFISMAKLTFDQKEKSLAMLTQAEKALHQSVNLTSQLLTFSKGGTPVKKVFALRPLIENSIAFALSGSRINYEIVADDNLRSIEADEGQIGQVIQNIVLNANQSMPLGGMIRVSVKNMPAAAIVPPADLQGDLVEISIRDQGTGIPPEHLARIFDPYFTTKEKGSGLGLATVYSIIKNHGGLVRVQSEVGKGTTFFIYLPASGAAVEEPKIPIIPAAVRKGRILVMDDEEIIRSVAGELLSALGHDVAFAQTGEAALEAYLAARDEGRPFDVVILDLTIRGGMGGMEALRKLVEIDPDVKAVVSSGYSDDMALSDYRKQGFRSFLKKPYNVEDLQRTMNSLLE